MAAANPMTKLLSHVILDLDGTLLNTDSIVNQVLKLFLVKYGKTWDNKKSHRIIGKTPYEAAAAIVEDYELPCSTEECISLITPMFSERWCNIKALPGANRLIKHLRSNRIPMALASNSPRSNIEVKISFHDGIEGTLPIEPWFIGGPVIKGYGRGSKVLGIPTANLPAESFSDLLCEHTSGVYFGWAGLSTRGIYKMVMSIGWNPYFDNTEKTIEPWLLHEFKEDFYGQELRLAIVGYIRPEANFPSLESLIARIHEDGRIAEKALDLPMYAGYKDSAYLRKPLGTEQ